MRFLLGQEGDKQTEGRLFLFKDVQDTSSSIKTRLTHYVCLMTSSNHRGTYVNLNPGLEMLWELQPEFFGAIVLVEEF